jgi:outer membrane immunogenic protein
VAVGWTLGGGLEYAVWQRWTLKAEYLYVSLDSKSFTETSVPAPGSGSASLVANFGRTTFNVGRVGVNYRF